MTMTKRNKRGARGSNAQQKTGPANANSKRLSKHQKAKRATANRKVQKKNAGTGTQREKEAESPADQKVERLTRGAEHKSQAHEQSDRRRRIIIPPPSKTPKKKIKASAASATDPSKRPSSSSKARSKQEDSDTTKQTPPAPTPVTKHSSLDGLIETSPEAHNDGYRAMKYSNILVELTYTVQSENPGASVFDGIVDHLNIVQNELERIMEQSREKYDAEAEPGEVPHIDQGGKRRKRVVGEDGRDVPVNTMGRKRVRK